MTEKSINKCLTSLAIKEPVRIATINKKELQKGGPNGNKKGVVFIKFHPLISEIYPYLILISAVAVVILFTTPFVMLFSI